MPTGKTIMHHLKESALILGLTLVLVGGLEGGLRLISPFHFTSAYVFDQQYLIRLKPGIESTFRRAPVNGGNLIRWRTNNEGFRGAELDETNDLRIIVYGDSNVQARFSKLEDTYAGRLETRLRRQTGRAVEVLNAGVIGFGPDQSLLRFQQEAAAYRPDAVIFHLFADNDFGDVIRNRLFEVDTKGRLVRTLVPPSEDAMLRFPSSFMLVREATNLLRAMLNRLSPERAKTDAGLFLCEAEYENYRTGRQHRFSHFADHYDFDVALFPNHPASQTKIRLMGALLQAAAAFATAQEIPLLLVVQPSARDLATSVRPNKADFAHYPTYRPGTLSALMAGLGQAHGLPTLNLWDVFAASEPASLYFKDDDHWNEAGQDLAAGVTAARLLEDLPHLFLAR